MTLDLVVLGNLIVDDIVYQDGSTRMGQPGGACLYMGLAAPLWGLSVGLSSVVGSDYPSEALDALAERGIDLTGIRSISGPGLRTWLLYEGDVRRVVHRLEGANHRTASPTISDFPTEWHPRAIHLAPMPIDHQKTLIHDLRKRFGKEIILSLDPFELLTEENLGDWRDLVSEIDLLFLSEDELPSILQQSDPVPMLQRIIPKSLNALIFKRGGRGGLALYDRGSQILEWTAQKVEVKDTTGAGDSFTVGVLAALLQNQTLQRALESGAVSASVAVEGHGATGLLQATGQLIRNRLERRLES